MCSRACPPFRVCRWKVWSKMKRCILAALTLLSALSAGAKVQLTPLFTDNLVLQRYFEPEFTKSGFLRRNNIRKQAEKMIEEYDIRSGQGPITVSRSMSGGNQQKAIIAREIEKEPGLLVAVQPTRGLDVGAIEFIHKQIVAQRDAGKAVLLVSLEMDEVLDVSDRILVMYEGEIVGQLDPKTTTPEEMGLYMAGAKREEVKA